MTPKDVTVEISTKNRYDILHLCLMSIANQTVSPKEVLIYDDGECKDLREEYIYKNVFHCLENKGINWKVLEGAKKGQIWNHQAALTDSQTEWLYRIDDDNILEANVLEKLLKHTDDPKVGAVGGSVIHPDCLFNEEVTSTTIRDVHFKYAAQFAPFKGTKEVEHMYSTFLIRKSAAKHGYPLYLSKIAHHEETIFTHEMFRAGWKLIVDGEAITYHFRAPSGGIRSESDLALWDSDENKLKEKLKEWGINTNDYFFMLNMHGLGDHYVMKGILPELRQKYPNKRFLIGATYPAVFFDEQDVEVMTPMSLLQLSRKPPLDYDVYELGYKLAWEGKIEDLFRKIYGLL